METLFLVWVGVFVIAILCAAAIIAVATVEPESSDAHQVLHGHESHPLEAPTH